MAAVKVGDHVTIGSSGSVHWIVKWIRGDQAELASGMTGVRRRADVSSLALFHRPEPDIAKILVAMLGDSFRVEDGVLVYQDSQSNRPKWMIEVKCFDITE